MNELYFDPDEHTLISFFKKRISCSCLDGMYKQVKSMKKLGICYNFYCTLPYCRAERNLMKSCSGCRSVNYCSRACQKMDWLRHKGYCYGYVQRDSTVAATTDDQYTNACAQEANEQSSSQHSSEYSLGLDDINYSFYSAESLK